MEITKEQADLFFLLIRDWLAGFEAEPDDLQYLEAKSFLVAQPPSDWRTTVLNACDREIERAKAGERRIGDQIGNH